MYFIKINLSRWHKYLCDPVFSNLRGVYQLMRRRKKSSRSKIVCYRCKINFDRLLRVPTYLKNTVQTQTLILIVAAFFRRVFDGTPNHSTRNFVWNVKICCTIFIDVFVWIWVLHFGEYKKPNKEIAQTSNQTRGVL